jgi:hypothetical protein
MYTFYSLFFLIQDTTTFIRAKDVMSIYHQVAKEVNKLNSVRDRQHQEGMISGSSAITNDEANVSPVSASRRGSASGRTALNQVSTPGDVPPGYGKDLKERPGMGEQNRTVSMDSSASSSTARQSDEEDEGEDESQASSRYPSAMSTPYEERTNHLDRFLNTRQSSARPSPTLSPQLDSTPVDEMDQVSAQLEQQHLSQIEVKPPTETNRVDQVLNDVFSLLSLFFLTIGKVKESPGAYCQVASMRVSLQLIIDQTHTTLTIRSLYSNYSII